MPGDEIHLSADADDLDGERLRVGVIGGGAIAQRLHLPDYADHDRVSLTAVCDVEEAKAEGLAEKYDADDWFTDYHDLLADAAIDAVSVCVPNHLHAAVTCAALERDIHVLCEKPISTTLADADRMCQAADATEAVFMVNQSHRFKPVYAKARQLLDSGLVGDVRNARVRYSHPGPEGWSPRSTWFTDAEAAGGGALMDIGIHNADLLASLVGEVASVTSMTTTLDASRDVEDNAVACLRFENGALGTFEVSWTTDPRTVELQLVGSEGVLTVDEVAETVTVRFSDNRGTLDVPVEDGSQYVANGRADGPQAESSIAAFVDAALRGADPPVSGREGRRALELVLAMYQAAEREQSVSLPLDGDVDNPASAE